MHLLGHYVNSNIHNFGDQTLQQTAGNVEQAGLLYRDIWVRKITYQL